MTRLTRLVGQMQWAWVAALGTVMLAQSVGLGQEGKSSLIRAGYTRPGSPDDPMKNGKVVNLALNPEFKGKLIGGTVYFAVYERTGKEGDPWSTGLANFNEQFMAGKDMQGNVSPKLDGKAKYLYVYQIVNDRGLNRPEVVPALEQEINAADLGSFQLKLPVASKSITSWGYFKNTGLTVVVPDRALTGAIRPVADGKSADIRLAVSANPSVESVLPKTRFQGNAPAVSLGDLKSSLRLGAGNMNLKDSYAQQMLAKKKENAKLVAWEGNLMTAADGAKEPEFVQFKSMSKNESSKDDTTTQFSVMWKEAIKLGQHSVVIAFTSDVGPGEDAARIKAAGDIKAVSDEGVVANGMVVVPQEAPQAVAAAAKARMPIRAGYTRPGNPSDLIKDGKIRPVAFQPEFKGKIIGGTVYFAVYERIEGMGEGDIWGTGLGNMTNLFVEGNSFKGNISPRLDTRGKYLYLYQIVNDRGLEQLTGKGIAGAGFDGNKELGTTDIASFALRLRVDPRYITSWGHFKTSGFNVQVPNRTRTGDIVPAADGADSEIALAVSSYNPILEEIPVKQYVNRSPAFGLPASMRQMFGVGSATLNLKAVDEHKQLAAKASEGIKLVGFENNLMKAAKTAMQPDFVQLIYAHADDRMTEGLRDEDMAMVVFRADFREIIKPGEHSVVFGFTTDLPPIDEPIRIEDPLAAQAATGKVIALQSNSAGSVGPVASTGLIPAAATTIAGLSVAQAPGAGVAPAAGVGTAPGPMAPAPAGGGGAQGVLGGTTGGGFGGGGGGFGGPAGIAGSIGTAPPPVFGGGGGVGGGEGGGQGSGQGEGDQGQNTGTIINFDATLNNQQSQDQNQQQQQKQKQNQNQKQNQHQKNRGHDHGHKHGHGHGHGDCNVIPEPGSILLALIGVPGMAYFWRRKTLAQVHG